LVAAYESAARIKNAGSAGRISVAMTGLRPLVFGLVKDQKPKTEDQKSNG